MPLPFADAQADDQVLAAIAAAGLGRLFVFSDAASGLLAFLAIDDVTLGPAAGGVRTAAYATPAAAIADAAALARAMTLKCALAGLDAGGGKCVVVAHPGLDRRRAFAVLGERVEELRGLFHTAGDLGTTGDDLAAMATRTRYVHTAEHGLAEAVARGLTGCIAVCADARGRSLDGLRVAIQGVGAIGTAAARALAVAGARLVLADLDEARAHALAAELGATTLPPAAILAADVDVVVPCAGGGVVDAATAAGLRAWALCGAANGIVADHAAALVLERRGILHVPDVIASAGAVIEGIGRSLMGLGDRTPLIDGLAATARAVLHEAERSGATPREVAEQLARARIAARAAAS